MDSRRELGLFSHLMGHLSLAHALNVSQRRGRYLNGARPLARLASEYFEIKAFAIITQRREVGLTWFVFKLEPQCAFLFLTPRVATRGNLTSDVLVNGTIAVLLRLLPRSIVAHLAQFLEGVSAPEKVALQLLLILKVV